MPTVEERVIRIVSEALEIPDDVDVRAESTFEDLGIDSLAAIELVFELEEEFDITITGDGIRRIDCLREVITGVERILAGEDAGFGGDAEWEGHVTG